MGDDRLPHSFIPAWLDDLGLSPAEFRVYCCLTRRGGKSRVAWPKWETIGAECRLGRTTVFRCIKELKRRGLIEVAGKPFGGSVRYRILSAIVPPETLLDAPIVPQANSNSSTRDTPIVPPEILEGNLKKNKKEKVAKDVLPFESEDFATTWNAWSQHRKEKKNPLTPTTRAAQLKMLSRHSEEVATEIIAKSIQNGWTGLFEHKTPTAFKTFQTSPTKFRL